MQLKEKMLAILKMLAVLVLFLMMMLLLSSVVGIVLGLIFEAPMMLLSQRGSIAMLVNGITSLIVIFAVCIVIAKIYKIKMKQLGMMATKGWLSHYGTGAAAGTATILAIWILTVILGGYKVTVNDFNQAVIISIVTNFITMLMVGYYEEVLSRGVMTFVGAKNSKLFNGVMVAIIFSLMHLSNPSYNVLSMLNTFLIAMIFSMITWIHGDLWGAIGYHAFWNFIMGSVLGVPISGIDTKGMLISTPVSSSLINGGGYGLEASLVCTLVLIIQMILIYVLWIAKGKTNQEPAIPWLVHQTPNSSD